MKTVILCGGFGTRIRDVSSDVPKPMIPVGNRPILWHVMRHYAHFGHREFVLCLGQATGGLISGGFFVLEPSFFDHLDGGDDLVLEQEPMRSLVAAKQLSVFQHDGFWQCMDTHRDWTMLNQMAERGSQPWKVW